MVDTEMRYQVGIAVGTLVRRRTSEGPPWRFGEHQSAHKLVGERPVIGRHGSLG